MTYTYTVLCGIKQIYTVLHLHISYSPFALTYMNKNKFYTLAQSVNKFHYGIYTYSECKSQTIYVHNAALDPVQTLQRIFLFAQHLSKFAENGYWIILNYSWAIGTSNVDQNMAPTNIILMMISMQQRMKKQAWIFASTHWKDFCNSILFWNYFHAIFLPFRTAYGLCLQVILMRVVWQSYGVLFTTTIPHTMKKGWQLQFNCWKFQNV